MKISIEINDLKSLESFASILANLLQKGDYILFHGEIGSGKTTLIKFIGKALGIDERTVTSPSFVIINEYQKNKLKIFHIDIYKLGENISISDIGLDDYYIDNGIVLIEWAEYLNDLNEHKGLHITMKPFENNKKIIEICTKDPEWLERLQKIKNQLEDKSCFL